MKEKRERLKDRGDTWRERVVALARDVRAGLRRRKFARMIRRSGLFEPGFYLDQCRDDAAARRDPIRHYLLHGAAAGLDPNPLFDTSYYAERYPEVVAGGRNPLVHFIRHGARERRSPSARFDTAFYLACNRDVAASDMNPLAHYLAFGLAEGRPCRRERDVQPGDTEVLDRAAALAKAGPGRRVLVVDRRIPTPDQDSGSVRMFAILKLARRLGHEVTFAADGEEPAGPYAAALERLGIEVVRGVGATVEHLRARGSEYGVALLSRPEAAEQYLTIVRAYALGATVVYDTVDLHWVRFARAADVTGDPRARAEADRYRRLERLNASCADLTLTVTEQDRDALLRDVPGARVAVLPNIHDCAEAPPPWEGRRDLLFVGGFDHAPNVDGVEWFVERVLSLVHGSLPGVVLDVVGSKVSDRVKRLRSATVRIVGHVPCVDPLLDAARVFVSPLRYGAGMKGKIGQSMARGLPVVTTSIGAEGMKLVDGENALVADDPAAFASAVVRLYTDERLWSRIARSSVRHVEEHFSETAVLERLANVLSTERAGGDRGGPDRARSGP